MNGVLTYYVYRHVRKDLNVPFYIGCSRTKPDADNFKWEYKRAFYDSQTRNDFWKEIVAITDYDVEIVFETTDKELAHKKETEFIRLYGRLDLGTGSLVNCNDGGIGQLNMNKKSLIRATEKRKKSGFYDRVKVLNGRPVYVYDITGRYLSEYISLREMESKTTIEVSTIGEYIKTKRSIYGLLLSYDKNINGLNIEEYKLSKHNGRPVLQIDENTGTPIAIYKTKNIIINEYKGSGIGFEAALKNYTVYKGFLWKYICPLEIEKYLNKYAIRIIRHGSKKEPA